MPRISWIEDADAEGEFAELLTPIRRTNPQYKMPAIMRTMSHRPDFLKAMREASRLHFSDGALTRAQHEMIASYVAAINRCHY